jgi:LSD1 subclass zinc finger protein
MFIAQRVIICKDISYLLPVIKQWPAKLVFIFLQSKFIDCKVCRNLLNLAKGFNKKVRAISSAGRAADS